MPAWLLPAVGAALSATGIFAGSRTSAKNRQSQIDQNASDRAYQQNLLRMQRVWAIKDRNYENTYNHPLQQMERLRQAGLNPHLVYGKGADMAAASTQSVSPSNTKQQAPHSAPISGLENIVSGFMATKQAQVSTDNLHAQGKLLEANYLKTLVETESKTYDLHMKNMLQDLIIEQTKADIDKTKANTDFTLSENQRQTLMHSHNVAKTLAEITRINLANEQDPIRRQILETQLQLFKHTEKVNQAHAHLLSIGITPDSPWYAKMLTEALRRMVEEHTK